MRDLTDIDRELDRLGASPDDCETLLERTLGPDRSRQRIDELLVTLVADVEQIRATHGQGHSGEHAGTASAPRALGRHARWSPPTVSFGPQAQTTSLRASFAGSPREAEETTTRNTLAGHLVPPPNVSAFDDAEARTLEMLPEPTVSDRGEGHDGMREQAVVDGTAVEAERAAVAVAAEEDFELLIEDEELLEIDDEEVELFEDEGA